VIGWTGSAGKTTTKDAIAHLLERATRWADGGNLNNHIGVPLSISAAAGRRADSGARNGDESRGGNRALAGMARARNRRGHQRRVRTRGILRIQLKASRGGKRELDRKPARDGVAVLNADDARVRGFRDAHAGRYGDVRFFGRGGTVRRKTVSAKRRRTRFRALGVDFETTLAAGTR